MTFGPILLIILLTDYFFELNIYMIILFVNATFGIIINYLIPIFIYIKSKNNFNIFSWTNLALIIFVYIFMSVVLSAFYWSLIEQYWID